MSIDEEVAQSWSEVSLVSVLESRQTHLKEEEVWALLKETCVALGPLEVSVENMWLQVDCLVLDQLGNIKVNLNHVVDNNFPNNDSPAKGKSLINSLGEMFKYIMFHYSDVGEEDDLFQLVDQMTLARFDDGFTIHNIELYADSQLNGANIASTPYNEFLESKRSQELSSAFQDSFLSTECSGNTEEDSDTDQSICITKDFDTLSITSTGQSFDNSEESKYFVCLNQLWTHCLDPIFVSDQEYLVFIHVILKEMSNVLLNEDNFKKCLCISKENVFLNPLGQMLLNFSSIYCSRCCKEKIISKYLDSKYINTIGAILHDICDSEHRVKISSQVDLLLQRMTRSTDMVISEILDFCKSNDSFHVASCRSILKRLYDRWNYWFNIHLHYLLNLKHKFLYEISTKSLKDTLKHVTTRYPLGVRELFLQHPSWISGLEYVTKLSKTCPGPLPAPPTSIEPNTSSSSKYLSSAFRKYNNPLILPPKPPHPSRIKTSTHFRPLMLTSESNSIHRSQDNMFSPIDVMPKFPNMLHTKDNFPPVVALHSSKIWRSMNQLPLVDINNDGLPNFLVQSSLRRSNNGKCDGNLSTQVPATNRSSKVNLIIDVIEAVLSKSFTSDNEEISDRHLLGVADFALSLGRLSKSIFVDAMKTRFIHIRWSDDSLTQLYDIISIKDIHTPLSDNVSSEMSSKEVDDSSKEHCLEGKSIDFLDRVDGSKEEVFENSKSNSVMSEASEVFEDLERQCAYSVINEPDPPVLPRKSCDSNIVKRKDNTLRKETVRRKTTSDADGSSDISDYLRVKTTPIIPNKRTSNCSMQSSEDLSFYQHISPATLLCFPSTLAYTNQSPSETPDQTVSANKIQELLLNFQDVNKTIRFKFKELSKTIDLISKCDENAKNGKKIKRRFLEDQKDLQLQIESLILSEMKLENTIVEHHSVILDTILDEIKSNRTKQSIIFLNDVRNFHSLQFVHPYALVTCLFARGAVSSGLLYEFLLVYREFSKPLDFIENLKGSFISIEQRLRNVSSLVTKARFRLLYIILSWIDGFYDIDINPQMMSSIKDLTRAQLVPFIRNTNQLIETAVTNARNSKTALTIQFTALDKKNVDIIHNVDIAKVVSDIHLNEKDKAKLLTRFSTTVSRDSSLGNQDTFSIFNISPKELATSLTLIQQTCFNAIHPCHLLLYLRSISDNDESILNSINNDRFPARTLLPGDTYHKEIRSFLLLSGQITHWAISEILLTTDHRLQAKIVKKLVLTLNWCKELNNYASMASIVEALTSDKLKWAPFWAHVSGKVTKSLKDVTCTVGRLFNSTNKWPDGHETSYNALLSGVAFIPCIHAILVHLKMSSFGNCLTRDGCLKWAKLRKLSKILDQIRLYKQFRYTSNDSAITNLRSKIKFRIEHLTSISLDILQSHNMLTQTS